jgi:parallel beta helix pectate lyase-like protein
MNRPFAFHRAAGLALVAVTTSSASAQTVLTTPTFNNIGIVLNVPAGIPGPAQLFVKSNGAPASAFREIHPLTRLSSTRFAGSAFGLDPGRTYDFRIDIASLPGPFSFSAATRPDNFPDATNATFHVSPVSGNDSNNGSSFALAFRTLGKALSVANPGGRILLYDGTYYEGDLTAPRSGTATAPIVIENAPGARPVLNGLNTNFTAVWTLHDAAAHVYRAPCASAPQNAYLNGAQLFHYPALADLLNPPWTQPVGYHVDGSFLYARFPDDSAPGTNIVTIPAHTTGLNIPRSNLQIRGVEFCYYGLDEFHRAIYIDGGDSNLIDRCYFHHNGIGVSLKRAADFNTVQNCVFNESPISTWSWHAVKDSGSDYEAGGFVIYGSTETNRGNVIRFCTFTNLFDAAHLYSDTATGPTENLDFHDNVVQGCNDDGIETDGAGSNCRIYFNRFHDFLTGVSVAPAAFGPTYIFRNVLSDWRNSEDFSGYPFKFNVSASLPIEWIYLYHNTCHTAVPGQHGFWFKQYSNWTNVISRNNIYSGTDYALENQANAPGTVDFDYDCLFTTKSPPVIRWAGVNYNSRGAFAAATGQELHGVTNKPLFLNPVAHDYYLPANSPLIDKGVSLPGINSDPLGAAPDLGALEHGIEARKISVSTNAVTIEWHVGAFGNYQFQYTTTLAPPAWTPLGGPVRAPSSALQLSDSPLPASPRFYRLQHVAP